MNADVVNRGSESLAIDLEKLLAPIAVERPSGEWLRYEGTYDAIEDARREDDANLPQGVWQRDLKNADWAKSMRLCQEALETRTKDLQIAVWLLEAWLHLYGFSGVEQGLKLLLGLSESFWDDAHPQIDEGDLESRTAPLRWMNEKLSDKLKRVPITHPETGDAPFYTWGDWEGALHLANVVRSDAAAARALEEKGRVSQAKLQVSVSLTRSTFYFELADQLRRAREGTEELGRFFETKCGQAAPSLGQFRSTLEAISSLVANVIRERMQEEDAEGAVSEDDRPAPASEAEEPETERSFTGGAIKSRAEAYRRLTEAAEYLFRTEPHSPAPYLVKRAVAWGGMPLAELLGELLRDNADLKTVYKLLGLKDKS